MASDLDLRLASGEDPSYDWSLQYRAAQLVSARARGHIVRRLQRVLSERSESTMLSSAIPGDARAVEVARPALEQLAGAIRSRESIRPQGVALTRLLLTEPVSVLYRPAHADELYEAARAALFALGPDRAPMSEPEQSVCLTLP